MATANLSLAQAKKKLELWSQKAKGIRERADAVIDQSLQSVEVGAAAGLSGLADGYAGKTLAVGGVPVDLLGALALHGVGYFSGMKNASHMHNLGDGLLAALAVKQGLKLGARMKETKQQGRGLIGADEPYLQLAQPAPAYAYGDEQALVRHAEP
ncbi:MAG TPA: hypothetical protein VFS00_19640 [Polyangiaceae bacterium]|nr:hypothetical protein [Polyangiaceae bacterium]